MFAQLMSEAASNTPPVVSTKVPSELFGIVLSGLITGLTAILVAIIQKKSARASTTQPFTISEADWCATRDRAITVSTGHAELYTRFDGHIKIADDAIDELRREIAHLKGQLGIQN